MYIMGLVQSSYYRGTKILQQTFEERKLKSEQGEDVIKHMIKLCNDYMQHFKANMVPYNALMTVINSLIDSSTPTFAVWAATKRISVFASSKTMLERPHLLFLSFQTRQQSNLSVTKLTTNTSPYWNQVSGSLLPLQKTKKPFPLPSSLRS